jgi:hypothetical protein
MNGKLIHSLDGQALEGAACLFKTLKVYPAKGDLIRMFDQTIPKVSNFPNLSTISITANNSIGCA